MSPMSNTKFNNQYGLYSDKHKMSHTQAAPPAMMGMISIPCFLTLS